MKVLILCIDNSCRNQFFSLITNKFPAHQEEINRSAQRKKTFTD